MAEYLLAEISRANGWVMGQRVKKRLILAKLWIGVGLRRHEHDNARKSLMSTRPDFGVAISTEAICDYANFEVFIELSWSLY